MKTFITLLMAIVLAVASASANPAYADVGGVTGGVGSGGVVATSAAIGGVTVPTFVAGTLVVAGVAAVASNTSHITITTTTGTSASVK